MDLEKRNLLLFLCLFSLSALWTEKQKGPEREFRSGQNVLKTVSADTDLQKRSVDVDDIAEVVLNGGNQGIKRIVEAVLVVLIERQSQNLHCAIAANDGRGTDEVSGLSVFTVLIGGNGKNAALIIENSRYDALERKTDAIVGGFFAVNDFVGFVADVFIDGLQTAERNVLFVQVFEQGFASDVAVGPADEGRIAMFAKDVGLSLIHI